MFNESNWQVALYLAYAFLIPPLSILIIDSLVRSLVRNLFRFYAITGLLGTPVHELGHVLACLAFGLKITKLRLYSPDPACGRLGYVEFAYRPTSIIHAVGLVVQGVAPMFAAFALFEFVFPSPQALAPWSTWGNGSSVVLEGVAGAWILVVGNFLADGQGFLWSVAALVIAMHCIPSWADIRLALRGGLVLLAGALGVSFLSTMDLGDHLPSSMNTVLSVVQSTSTHWGMVALEWFIYAVTLVTVTAVAGLVVLLVLPAACVALLRRVRSPSDGQRRSAAHDLQPGVDGELSGSE